MQKILFFILMVIMVYACSKSDFTSEHTINDLVAEFDQETQDRSKLRLAFGKAVAAALGEQEFRDYIKNKSHKEGSELFEELVFLLIKDDVLPSGRTVSQMIQAHEDSKVKALYGNNLVDEVLKNDPMVAIKLPDLFFDMDWDTRDVIPFVGVQTALPFPIRGYIHYYHNGYHEFISDYNTFDYSEQKYFYIAVQHATNHILLNLSTMTNEKGITLEEFLPQIYYAKNDVMSDILMSGERVSELANQVIINLRTAYDIWLEKNKFEGEFAGDIEPCGTRPMCLRDCIEDPTIAHRLVMTGFELGNDLAISGFGLSFTETIVLSFDFLNRLDVQKLFRFTRPTRRAEILPDMDVKVFTTKKSYKGKTFDVPLVEVKYTRINENNRKWIDINYLLDSDFQKGKTDYSICVQLLIYSDLYNGETVCQPIFPINFASSKRIVDAIDHDWCYNDKTNGNGLKLGLVP